jgi:hypothetical protein
VNSTQGGGGEEKTGLGLGSIPCRILGKHHTPRMGGVDLSLYRIRLGVHVIQYKTIYNSIYLTSETSGDGGLILERRERWRARGERVCAREGGDAARWNWNGGRN